MDKKIIRAHKAPAASCVAEIKMLEYSEDEEIGKPPRKQCMIDADAIEQVLADTLPKMTYDMIRSMMNAREED